MTEVAPRPAIVGREAEQQRLADFHGPDQSAGTFLLAGAAGIGKTTLWEASIQVAEAGGWLVLSARTSEAESGLSFAALSDLLAQVPEDAITGVPPPQRRALEVALQRVEPQGGPPDPLAIAAGLLGVFRELVTDRKLLIAIDDVQWLDESSADAIAFAGRRIVGPRAHFLISRRPAASSHLERALKPRGMSTLDLAPLSIGAISRLLTDRLGLTVPRRALREIVNTAQGNPLLAIEIGRLVGRTDAPGADLPIPDLVEDAFGPRIRALSPSVRRVVLAVALESGLSRSDLESLGDSAAVETALSDGLLIAERDRIRATHPMILAAARQAAGPAEVTDLDRALAQVVTDPVAKARHLTRAATGPDPALATTVAAAAGLAIQRGATHEAEELAGHALRLTEHESPDWSDRVLTLARCIDDNGDFNALAALLTAHLEQLHPSIKRAEACLLLDQATRVTPDDEYLTQALTEAGDDLAMRAAVLAQRSARYSVRTLTNIALAEEFAVAAAAAAAQLPADRRPPVEFALGWTHILRGTPVDELADSAAAVPVGTAFYLHSLERIRTIQAAFRGRIGIAVDGFDRLLAESNKRGDLGSVFAIQLQQAELAIRSGKADMAQALTDELDIPVLETTIFRLRALTAAVRGNPTEARQWIDRYHASDESVAVGGAWQEVEIARATALATLFEGDHAAAARLLLTLHNQLRDCGVRELGAFPIVPDLVESLVLSGGLAAADEVVGELAAAPYLALSPWATTSLARVRATTSLSRRYDDAERDHLIEAAATYADLGLEFDAARTLLFAGRLERRHNRRSNARVHLEAAAHRFDANGSTGWAALARDEAARVSGRRGRAHNALTDSERRVAELAAAGLSNKEIAAELIVTIHTVQAHLSHTYAKLGVRSRTQLAHVLGTATTDN